MQSMIRLPGQCQYADPAEGEAVYDSRSNSDRFRRASGGGARAGAGARAPAGPAGADRRRGDAALRRARVRGRAGRGDRAGGRRGQGRGVRLLHQQGRPVPGHVPGRGPLVQQLPGGAAGGLRAGLLRGHQVLARAHAASGPRGLGALPGDPDRQLLLQPAAAARDHPVPAARGSVRDPGVRAVRHRPWRDPPRHRRQDGRVPGGLADGPLPGRDRDRGAGPRAVRFGRPVSAHARRGVAAVRRVAAQRHRGGFRGRRRAAA